MRSRLYDSWREWEAYAVPVTEQGMKAMERRRQQYYAGFAAGVDAAVEMLMEHHGNVKDVHNYYYVAAKMIRELYRDGKDL